MSGRIRPYIDSGAIDLAAYRALGSGGALLHNNGLKTAPMFGGELVGRDSVAFPDGIALPATEKECYDLGAERMGEFYQRWPYPLSGRMGANEDNPVTIGGAGRRGAFEGGAASVCWAHGEAYYAANFSYGGPPTEIVVAWAQGFQRWAPIRPAGARLVLAYHGYRKPGGRVVDFERRPFDDCPEHESWRTALSRLGLWNMFDRVEMTEDGVDAGPEAGDANGYKGQMTSEEFGAIIRGRPELVPECAAFYEYLFTTISPERWWSFDYADDAVVKSVIRETNQKGETPMLEAWDRAKVWADYRARSDEFPAFDKYLPQHPELGGWIDDAEYDVGGIRLRGAAGGLVWARIGDWGNVRHATYLAQLPLAP